MNKNVRNLAIAIVLSLIVGYIAGGASQTGRCPITGMVMCKDKAAACDRAKACAEKCEAEKSCDEAKTEEAPKAPEAAK